MISIQTCLRAAALFFATILFLAAIERYAFDTAIVAAGMLQLLIGYIIGALTIRAHANHYRYPKERNPKAAARPFRRTDADGQF